jgi:hypothetical protein
MLQNMDRAFVEYWLALALTTIAAILGHLDPISKFGQVRNAPRPVASNVVSVGNFEG